MFTDAAVKRLSTTCSATFAVRATNVRECSVSDFCSRVPRQGVRGQRSPRLIKKYKNVAKSW
jgi:hypothetical protein